MSQSEWPLHGKCMAREGVVFHNILKNNFRFIWFKYQVYSKIILLRYVINLIIFNFTLSLNMVKPTKISRGKGDNNSCKHISGSKKWLATGLDCLGSCLGAFTGNQLTLSLSCLILGEHNIICGFCLWIKNIFFIAVPYIFLSLHLSFFFLAYRCIFFPLPFCCLGDCIWSCTAGNPKMEWTSLGMDFPFCCLWTILGCVWTVYCRCRW